MRATKMKIKKDDAINEVIGFVFVLLIVVVFVSLFIAAVMPAYIENNEAARNNLAALEFAELKNDIDLTRISKLTGVTEIKTIDFAANRDSNLISDLLPVERYGSLYLKKGNKTASGNYCNLVIEYTSSNKFANDVSIVYDGGALISNTEGDRKTILGRDSDYRVVTTNDFSETVISGIDFAVLEYSLLDINDDERYCVLDMRIVL